MRTIVTLVLVISVWTVQAQRYEWITTADQPALFGPFVKLCSTPDGGGLILFKFQAPAQFGGQPLTAYGGEDLAVAKLAADGTVQWTTTFGSPGGDGVQDLGVDGAGNVYASYYSGWGVTSFADTTYSGSNLYQVVQLDANGAFKRAISTNGIARLAGIRHELYVGVGPSIVRMDTTLAATWTQSLSEPGTFGGSTVNNAGIAVRGDRVVAYGYELTGSPLTIAGLTLPNNGAGFDQGIVVCLDTAGTGLWGYTTDGTNGTGDAIHGIALDGAGRAYAGIYSYAAPFTFAGTLVTNANANPNVCALVRFDVAGNEEWVTTFEPVGGATVDAIAVNAAGESFMTGSHSMGGSMGGMALGAGGAYLGKVANDGSTVWLVGAEGYAGNAGGNDLDAGVMGTPWWFITNYGALNMHCVPITAGGSNTNLIIAEVTDLPPVAPSAGFSFVFNGLDVQFTDASVNATGWNWDFGDGSPSSSAQDPSHAYAAPGIYTVTLTVNLNGVCTAVSSQEVDLLGTGVGTFVGGRPRMWVAPSPCTHVVGVTCSSPMRSIQLVDAAGRSVLDQGAFADPYRVTLDVAPLPSGSYILRVRTEQDHLTDRLVKL